MNLVAKEFVAARDDEQGMLILSRFAGASRELRDAVLINPTTSSKLQKRFGNLLRWDPQKKAQECSACERC
jgi:trehalose-6-phosphate synthase